MSIVRNQNRDETSSKTELTKINSINTININIDKDRTWSDFINEHNVKSIPTILISFDDAAPVHYDGEISRTALVDYTSKNHVR